MTDAQAITGLLTAAATAPTPPVPAPTPAASAQNTSADADFIVSEGQLNTTFPSRNGFHAHSGPTDVLSAYPAFTHTGGTTVQKQEAAAFLENASHETGGLVHVVEQNTADYHYCDAGQWYGCPAGMDGYDGRGPIQLGWNLGYEAAGGALGIDLFHNPDLVQNNSSVSWKTGLWYWNTRSGAGPQRHGRRRQIR